jgi:four helix bundle protein
MKHESTRIYTTSLELNRVSALVVGRLPPGYGFLADQLRRAAASVTLNFSEGCRRTSRAERRRFFTVAGASASEVSAVVDVAHAHRVIRDDDRAKAKDLCDHLSAMLRLYR